MDTIIKRILREEVTKTKVICDGCGWSWKLSEGGDDKYICHKCGNDNTPKDSNLGKVLSGYKESLKINSTKTIETIGTFVKKYIEKNKFNVKFLKSCPTSFQGVRTRDQIIICSPSSYKSLGDFLYVIFHEIRHEQQISRILMDNPLTGDLDDFESLYEKYWEMELDADQFAKNMLIKLISKLNLPEEEIIKNFKLSAYIENYPTLSNSVRFSLNAIVSQIKEMKKRGIPYEDIQDHPMIKTYLDKLEDFL